MLALFDSINKERPVMAASTVDDLTSGVIRERNRAAMKVMPWLAVALSGSFLAWNAELIGFDLSFASFTTGQTLFLVSIVPWIGAFIFGQKMNEHRILLSESRDAEAELRRAEGASSISSIEASITRIKEQAETNPLIQAHLQARLPIILESVRKIRREELQASLNKELHSVTGRISPRLAACKADLPIFKARAGIKASLRFLETRKPELQAQWDAAYENFSWWNKLKYSGGPDFTEIDAMIRDLQKMEIRLEREHGEDFTALDKHFEKREACVISRVLEAQQKAEDFVRMHGSEGAIRSDLLKKAMWLSMLSIPISLWSDVIRAGDVFDSVRGVSGEFAGMSDSELWWETLFMPTESLAGLAALTKGAYFEELVAADTGGVLHEHFNHPDTDVVIDGTAFQLKATDSESYVNSVADGIPVISTSEVAYATGSIDSGYSNEDLNNSVDLALGSTVVDFGDTTVDAVLAGVGGLGFFATLQGLNHAVKKHENGGDAVEAIFEGAGVAIEGTARALVGAAEMGYKVLSSKPSRFVGRMMLKGLVKLDEKMTGQPDRK
jgi:hypothetical protein